ncbi:MAG: TerC family protein [Pseudomonadota bacterium]
MFGLDSAFIADVAAIIWLDIVLSGDNALVIGMAAATLAPHLRRRAILFGMILATVIRVACAVVATYLYEIAWIRFVGGLALIWVAWKLWEEARELNKKKAGEPEVEAQSLSAAAAADAQGATDRKSIMKALITITIADVSMSIDNVLAVAGIAHDNRGLLIFGLVLSIALMAFFATVIMKVMVKYPVISFIGVAVLLYVAGEMIYHSYEEMALAIGIDLSGLQF